MAPRKNDENDETTELDTSKLRTPNEDTTEESTPLFDETTAYLQDADEADVTHFEEDDDPLSLVGDPVDDEEENA